MADKYLNITGKLVKLIDAGDGTFFLATKSSTAETLMGTKTDAAATVADATPFSIIALLKGIFAKLLGTLNVQLSGSNMDLRGKSADKPAATAVTIGATYWSVDTDPHGSAIEVSNGTSWVVI